jgi:DNA-directed RNA polymerase subunit RPC12/RpoP
MIEPYKVRIKIWQYKWFPKLNLWRWVFYHYGCTYCGKMFKTTEHQERHMSKCKEKPVFMERVSGFEQYYD